MVHYDRKQIAVQFVDMYMQNWQRTGNPISVWRAYVMCRDAGIEIPEWIYSYLDAVARNIWDMTTADSVLPAKGEILPAIAEAFAMKRKGKSGWGNVFADHMAETDKVMVCMRVDWYLRGDEKLHLANEYVADEYKAKGEKMSASKVRRIWDELGPICFPVTYAKT